MLTENLLIAPLLDEDYQAFESYDDDYSPNLLSPMNYSDFTNEYAQIVFDLDTQKTNLFEAIPTITPSEYIQTTLKRGLKMPLLNEKVRSEVLVSPLLVEVKELNENKISLFSGATLNVDKERGLVGRCDFILSNHPNTDILSSPLFTLVEAKHQNIEGAYGQAIAQMVACRLFNEAQKHPIPVIFGCITTGEIWQFLKLENQLFTIDQEKYFLKYDLGKILGVFQDIIDLMFLNNLPKSQS